MTRYIALFILLFIGMSGCKEPEKKALVTHELVKTMCEKPSASFPMNVLGIPILLFHHDNCMSHDVLLTVVWPNVGEELEPKAADLVALAYARFQSSGTKKCTRTFLNHDASEDEVMTASFYVLKCTEKEKENDD